MVRVVNWSCLVFDSSGPKIHFVLLGTQITIITTEQTTYMDNMERDRVEGPSAAARGSLPHRVENNHFISLVE